MKERKTTNKKWLSTVITLCLLAAGCATNVASVKKPNWEKKPINVETHDYTILGTVKLEKKWFGIFGFSVSQAGIDAYAYQKGGITYADMLEAAREQYPEADAVIDMKVDHAGSTYAIFYAQRKNIVTGIAVKYVKEPKPNNPALK